MTYIFKEGQGELLFRLPDHQRPEMSFAGPIRQGLALVVHTNGEVRMVEVPTPENVDSPTTNKKEEQ